MLFRLEAALKRYTVLTKGDVIQINWKDQQFDVLIAGVEPQNSQQCISILDADVEVDFLRALDASVDNFSSSVLSGSITPRSTVTKATTPRQTTAMKPKATKPLSRPTTDAPKQSGNKPIKLPVKNASALAIPGVPSHYKIRQTDEPYDTSKFPGKGYTTQQEVVIPSKPIRAVQTGPPASAKKDSMALIPFIPFGGSGYRLE